MCIEEKDVNGYLAYCRDERRLDKKTLRAYKCDLLQMRQWTCERGAMSFGREELRAYLAHLNSCYAPASVKRKLASANAFLSYQLREGLIAENPFSTTDLAFRKPKRLPRVIPMDALESLFSFDGRAEGFSEARNRAVLEMLIATGLRVSELCSLDVVDCDMLSRTVRVSGKGSKERVVQLESEPAVLALDCYLAERDALCRACGWDTAALFVNRLGKRITDYSVRYIIKERADDVGISIRITPHMFRHTFATLLLESDVDIRYIQSLLGHSSLRTTEVYTHVAGAKQRDIMRKHNPRNAINGGK